ncbi:MAG: beta strand repeat-containing protein, partial [Gaiellaceae bacterium]
YSTGSSGGIIAATGNSANVTASATVKAYALSTLVTAGGDVSIESFSASRTNAHATNSGGGLVGIGNASTSSLVTSDTEAYVGDDTHQSRIVTAGNFSLKATTANIATGSDNASAGGGIGVANARDVTVEVDYDTEVGLGSQSAVVAGGNVVVAALTGTSVDANAHASGAGFGADGHSTAKAYVGHNGDGLTQAQIGSGASLVGETASVSARVDDVCVGGTGAGCTGGYTVAGLSTNAHSESYGAGFYSEGIDSADTEVGNSDSTNPHQVANRVILNGSDAIVTGLQGVDFLATFNDVKTFASSFARASGLFGYVSASVTNNTDLDTSVEGDATALVTAGPRLPGGPLTGNLPLTRVAFYVDTDNTNVSADDSAHVSKRSLAGGGDHHHGDAGGTAQEHKSIAFSSDVTILSGWSPQVIIDQGGNVQLAVQATVYDASGTAIAQGSHVDGTTVVVGDLVNPGPGNVVFRAGNASSNGYSIADQSTGVSGTWTFEAGLPNVPITNLSDDTLQIDDIRVLTTAPPTVDLGADPDVSGFSFNIRQAVSPTIVDIENNGSGDIVLNGTIENPIGVTEIRNTGGAITSSSARGTSNDVPFTETSRPAPCGGADGATGTGHYSIVCTNILDLETTGASQDIGTSSARINVDYVETALVPEATSFNTGRVSTLTNAIFLGINQFFSGEEVQYTAAGTAIGGLANGAYYWVTESADGQSVQLSATPGGAPITLDPGAASHFTDGNALLPVQRFTVDSTGSAYLDVRGLQRTNESPTPAFTVNVDHVQTAGTADLLLQTSMLQTGLGIGGGVNVIYAGHASPGEPHYTFFNQVDSDCTETPTPSACTLDVGAFASGTTKVDSVYDFRALDTGGNETLPAITAGGNIVVRYAEVVNDASYDAHTIDILGITELHGASDLEGAGHIDVLTDGWIGEPATTTTAAIPFVEYTLDLRVGVIQSTQNDAVLASPRAILDAVNTRDATTSPFNVAGVNVTMTAGNNGIASSPSGGITGAGGVGTPGDFLELEVGTGVLTVTDTQVGRATASDFPTLPLSDVSDVLGAPTGTYGVYLTQTSGDLRINTVTTSADASIATAAGSILDGLNTGNAGIALPNVLADNVDLNALGGSIGAGDGANDLKIWSGANLH